MISRGKSSNKAEKQTFEAITASDICLKRLSYKLTKKNI